MSPSCTCGHLSAAGSAAPVLMAGGSSHHLLIPALCPVLPLVSRCKYNTVYQILKTRQYSVELSENWDLVIEKAQRGLCLSSLPLLCGAFPPECFFRTPNQSHDAFTRSSLSCFKRCRRQSCQNLSKLFSCSPDSLADLFSNSFEDAPCCFRVTSLITRRVFFPAAWLREMEAFGCFFPRRGALWWISMLSITPPLPPPVSPESDAQLPGFVFSLEAWLSRSSTPPFIYFFKSASAVILADSPPSRGRKLCPPFHLEFIL